MIAYGQTMKGGVTVAQQMFRVAWAFFVIAAGIGALLRLYFIVPLPSFQYDHVLHAHSHIAFLGWVFNAFFAAAWLYFVPDAKRRRFLWLFFVLQVANVGMLASFPVEGYGPFAIAFSSLHSVGGILFAVWLWYPAGVHPATRAWLRAALVCMVASGLGPVLLGPLAAMDLRESAGYNLSVLWFLHFQYNGWFMLFPISVGMHLIGNTPAGQMLERAFWPFIAGVVLTFLISVLWLEPPGWVFAAAGVGGLLQLAGAVWIVRAFGRTLWAPSPGKPAAQRKSEPAAEMGSRRELRPHSETTLVRVLLLLALASFVVKVIAQAISTLPALAPFVNNHFTAIGFLHWVFLFVVPPAAVAFALRQRWLRADAFCKWSIGVFLTGALLSQTVLFYVPAAAFLGGPSWPHLQATLLAAALLKVAGLAGVYLLLHRSDGALNPQAATNQTKAAPGRRIP